MIITCNECNTRFNLNESLLKQTGSKVRCSKCKNVFLAYPSSLSEEPDKSSEVMAETEFEAAIPDEETEFGEQYKVEEADMELQGIDLSDIDNSLEIDEELKPEKETEETGFELDLDLETEETGLELDLDLETVTDETQAETEAELETEIDDKADSGISAEEEIEDIEPATDEAFEKEPEETGLELDLDLEPVTDETQAETEAELEIEIDDITEDKEAETKIEESKAEEIDEDVIPAEDVSEKIEDEEEASKAFNMGTISDEQKAEKSTAIADKVEEGIIADESQPKVAAKKRISMPVLLLLLAALLISGAYGTYVLLDSVGINIPFVSDLLKPEVQDAGNLKIYTSDINNKFVENSKIGKLLVITGKAKNGYSDSRSFISITGKLYTKGKILSKTKTVYCGTILSEPDLLNMDLDAINNRLSNRFGDNKSNVKVKAGAIIPFMLVFAELPENLDEFTIEVAGSFP